MPQPLRTTVLVGCFAVWDSNGRFQETASSEGLVTPRELRVEGKEKKLFVVHKEPKSECKQNKQKDTMLRQRKGGGGDGETQVYTSR